MKNIEERTFNSEKNIRLNNILIRERKKKGWSQREFGKKFGRSQSFVARYEANQTILNALELSAIVKVLDYPIAAIFEELESWAPSGKEPSAGDSAIEAEQSPAVDIKADIEAIIKSDLPVHLKYELLERRSGMTSLEDRHELLLRVVFGNDRLVPEVLSSNKSDIKIPVSQTQVITRQKRTFLSLKKRK